MNPSGARQERDGHRRRGEDLKPLPPPNRLARAGWKTVADGGERNDEEKRPKKMSERCLLPSGRVFPKTWTVSTEVDLTRQPKNEGAPRWEQTPPLSALDPLSHGADTANERNTRVTYSNSIT